MVEQVGSDVLISLSPHREVFRVSTPESQLLLSIRDGHGVLEGTESLKYLLSRGLVEDASQLTRRSALIGAGSVVGAGILSLALPTPAMASSTTEITVSDTAFTWEESGARTDPEGNSWVNGFWSLEGSLSNSAPFAAGDQWTMEVATTSTFSPSLTIDPISLVLEDDGTLSYTTGSYRFWPTADAYPPIFIENPDDSEVTIFGRLSQGSTVSNIFRVPYGG